MNICPYPSTCMLTFCDAGKRNLARLAATDPGTAPAYTALVSDPPRPRLEVRKAEGRFYAVDHSTRMAYPFGSSTGPGGSLECAKRAVDGGPSHVASFSGDTDRYAEATAPGSVPATAYTPTAKPEEAPTVNPTTPALPRTIAFCNIRKGDTVRLTRRVGGATVTREGVVSDVRDGGPVRDRTVTFGDRSRGGHSTFAVLSGETVTLVSRPAPKLPTEAGAVILARTTRDARRGEGKLRPFMLDDDGDWMDSLAGSGIHWSTPGDIAPGWKSTRVVPVEEAGGNV